jgi:hypothetical protein
LCGRYHMHKDKNPLIRSIQTRWSEVSSVTYFNVCYLDCYMGNQTKFCPGTICCFHLLLPKTTKYSRN